MNQEQSGTDNWQKLPEQEQVYTPQPTENEQIEGAAPIPDPAPQQQTVLAETSNAMSASETPVESAATSVPEGVSRDQMSLNALAAEPASVAISDAEPASVVDSSQQVVTPPPSGSGGGKKKYIFAGLAAVLAVGLLGGGAYAYTTYQKPENVILDAASKALSAKQVRAKTTITSDFVYSAGDTSISFDKLTFETGSERTPRVDEHAELAITYNKKPITLKADVLATDAGELYFKVSNLKDTIQKAMDGDIKITAAADAYLAKIDGKWAKYTLADLKKDNPEVGKAVQCTLDVYKKHKDDSKSTNELVDLYKKNQFVVIKGNPTSKNGTVGYVVDVDKTKLDAFDKSAQDLAIAKELKSCTGQSSEVAPVNESMITNGVEGESSDKPKTTTTIWVSQWTHDVRSIDTVITGISGPMDKKATVTMHTGFDFTKGVTTVPPSDAMKAADWLDNGSKAFNEMTSGAMAGVQAKANESQAQSNAISVLKRAEAYYAMNGIYPSSLADFAKTEETKLDAGVVLVASLPQDESQTGYKKCSNGGAQVVYLKSDKTYAAYSAGGASDTPQIITTLCK